MIKDLEKTVTYISKWIADHAITAGAKTLVVGISGGVDSAVVAGICKRTGIQTIGVRMPCHSSASSLSRGQEVIDTFGLTGHTVDLEGAFDTIIRQLPLTAVDERVSRGSLRSCLRAPTLDFVGKIYEGLIVGTGNRDEDEVTRYYQKRGDGCVDISPIARLHKSEIYQLAEYLSVPRSVIDAVPSADLWGPDSGQTDESQLQMSYKEVEWGIRQAELHGGTFGCVRKGHFDAALHSDAVWSDREVSVLSKLGRMEEVSRHKENPGLPVCDVRAAHLGLLVWS